MSFLDRIRRRNPTPTEQYSEPIGPQRPSEKQTLKDISDSQKNILTPPTGKMDEKGNIVPLPNYRQSGGGGGGSSSNNRSSGGSSPTTPSQAPTPQVSIGQVTPEKAMGNKITFQAKSVSPTPAQVQKLYNLTTQERTTTNTIRNNKGQVVGGFTETSREQIQFDTKPKPKPQFGDRSKLKGYAQIGEEPSSSFISSGGKITSLGSQKNKATDIIKGYGTSVKDLVMSVPELGKAIINDPVAPVKLPLNVIKKVRAGTPEVGEAIRNKPFYTTGYTAGFVTGPKVIETAIVKTSDIARTIRLKEIKSESVIAPEFTAGQKYPQIKKGETAGELLKEFKVQFPNEVKPAGFTASPNPLKGNKLGAGSSELPGFYQAPKVSPTFLKVSGGESATIESTISSIKQGKLNLLPTIRPTTFRTTPTKYELLKGVKPSQSSLLPIRKAQQSFAKNTKLGRAYIPFLKTEKEAVIPAGTLLKPKDNRYYFKFEGRRIPIKEYETTEDVLNAVKAKPVQDVIGSYKYQIEEPTIRPKDLSYGKQSYSEPFRSMYSKGSYSYVRRPLISSLTSSSSSSKSGSKSSSSGSSSVSKAIASLSSSVSSGGSSSSSFLSYPSRSSYGSKSSSYGKIIKTPKPNYPRPFNYKSKYNDRNKQTEGYRPYYKRKGKTIFLSGIYSKGQALRKAESYALGNLRATIGVKQTSMKINAPVSTYKPNPLLFRDFRIKEGRRMYLQDEFIQRRGKRLSNIREVKSLQNTRRTR